MGSYTSLVVSARLREDTPSEILCDLKELLYDSQDVSEILGSECERNPLTGSSAYSPEHVSSLDLTKNPGGFSLSVVSSVKNYNREIEKFLDWIGPYVSQGHGESEWWALVTHETYMEPRIYYLKPDVTDLSNPYEGI